MADELEFDSIDVITVGTIGGPGERIFHLQIGKDNDLLTLTLEKQQAMALADGIDNILVEIADDYKLQTPEADLSKFDLDLLEPILPAFRIAQMGLGYNKETDMVIIIIRELLPEDAPTEPRVVRASVTREQIKALTTYCRDVIDGGRPICGNCGRPMDADGHFCPKSNGHGKKAIWA